MPRGGFDYTPLMWGLVAVAVLWVGISWVQDSGFTGFNFNVTLPFNIQIPGLTSQQTSTPTGGTTNYYTTSNSLKPTSLIISLNQYTAPRGTFITGAVVGNGYNYPIVIHARVVATGAEAQGGAFLNANGQWIYGQTMDTAGQVQLWVTCEGVTSNTVLLTIT